MTKLNLDLVPASDYDTTLDTATCGSGTATSSWIEVNNPAAGNNMCIEQWNIGKRGTSCVRVEGYFRRAKALEDATNDAACDLIMDYVSYEVKI